MITPMKKIEVSGITESRKAVMEEIQKLGCVEFKISDEEENDERLKHLDVSGKISQFERYLSQSEQALSILNEYVPEKTGMFSVRKSISLDKYSMETDEINTVGNVAVEIIRLSKKIKDNELKISRKNSKIMAITPWLPLDVALNTAGTENTVCGLYTLPFDADVNTVDSYLEDAEYIYYEIVNGFREQTCIFLLYPKEFKEEYEKLLREKGFVLSPPTLSRRTASGKIQKIKSEIEDLLTENDTIAEKIKSLAEKREELKLLADHLNIRIEKYEKLKNVLSTKSTFYIEGYIPEDKCMPVKRKLEETGVCFVSYSDVPDDEEAPILFKNNGFAQPVEGITKTYAMPSKTDIDPNFIMAIFYYLFFGMMFSDMGYGILLALGAGYFAFYGKVEQELKNTMKMFFFCGLSTTFWGLMYGSFFGDAIYRISVTFFGKEIVFKPLWIDPVKEPLLLLITSVALGMVQILIGLMIKFYVDFRSGDKKAAFFDTGSWIIILSGICLAAAGIGLNIEILKTIGMYLAIFGALIIVLFKGRENKNPIARVFSGILGLYDITSFVSDALSYSRLMALGLATGVIAQVVNIMGTLSGGGALNAIIFAVVFVVGHLLNFAINALGAYVHTNRLQYVEFFGKFYEGGGREFNPLSVNTKYYKFMEDESKC